MRQLVILLGSLAWLTATAADAANIGIPAGTFRPLFGAVGKDLAVGAFRIDELAVSNGEFLRFTKAHPEWAKAKVKAEFADSNYLLEWKGGRPRKAAERLPVVGVSWFAAEAFCESRGGRLPSTLEWEFAGAASKDVKDASRDQKFQEKILQWYSDRSRALSPKPEANAYGVRGMHGQVWEWTSDFNAFFVAADNRQDGDQSKNFFCGAGATGADNRENYAAFMRYALRSSLQANYTLNSLGFRCAYDQK